jgi:predicted Zn-dependent protease
LFDLGHAYRLLGRSEDAIAALQRLLIRNPDFPPAHIHLAVIYSERNRREEAHAAVAERLRVSPLTSLASLRQRVPYQDPAVLERLLEALRQAGLQ